MIVLQLLAVVLGLGLVVAVLISALKTVVLPSGGLTAISRLVFAGSHRVFIAPVTRPFASRRRPLYAPVALVTLPLVWTMLVTIGFTFVFWGLDAGTLSASFVTSGSSLFTLGFVKPDNDGLVAVTFIEATIGLGLVALLISYLPTIYTAFSAREKGVTTLRPLVGQPPRATELIRRLHFGQSVRSGPIWTNACSWFAEVEQSHTAFPALCSFPSQNDHAWVSSAGAMLDAAALLLSCLHDEAPSAEAQYVLLLAQGVPSVVRIGRSAGLPLGPPLELIEVAQRFGDDPPSILVTRAEFDEARTILTAAGLPVGPDADRAWQAFSWIRSTYEPAVVGLAAFTDAPGLPWGVTTPAIVGRPWFFHQRPVTVVWPDGIAPLADG